MKNINKVVAWNDEGRRGTGVIRLGDNMTIEFEKLSGCNPDWLYLIKFLVKDKDVQLGIREYLQRGRRETFSIQVDGHDGWENFWLATTTRDGLVKRSIFLLHVSCFRCVEQFSMYIGDFAELALYYIKHSAVDLRNKKQKPTMWYAEPHQIEPWYLNDEPSVDELHRLMGIGGDN